MKKQRMTRAIYAIGLVLALLAMVWGMTACQAEEPEARSYNCNVYTEQGCDKFVIASGGELEVQSGATIDIQSGATTDYSGGIDLDGALLDLDADGDTSITADTDDQIDIEISTADEFVFTADQLDVTLGQIVNIGNAGTDFDASGGLTLAAPLFLSDGTNTAPAIATTTDVNTGFYRAAADNLGLSINGTLDFDWAANDMDFNTSIASNIGNAGTDFNSSGGLTLAAPVLLPDGAVGAPAIANTTDTNTGFYRVSEDVLGLAINGALDYSWAANDMDFATSIASNIGNAGTDFNSSGGLTLAAPLLFPAGAVGAPGVASSDDTNTGLYRVSEDVLGLAINGALDFEFNANDLDFTTSVATNIGNAGTDFNSSGGLTTAAGITITAGGASITAGNLDMTDGQILNVGASGTDFSASGGLTLAAPVLLPDGAVGAPALANSTDTDTGFYRIGEDNLGLAIQGVLDFDFGANDFDLNTSIMSNIGNAGTDFDTNGGLVLAAPIAHASGTYTLPQITWTGDTNAGFYHVGADNIGVSLNGALDFDFGANDLDFNTSIATNIGNAGTDFGSSGELTLAGSLIVAADVATIAAAPAAGSGGDLIDLTDTFGIADGADDMLGIDINLTGANHAGASNSTIGIDLGLTTPDDQTPSKGLLIADADWDYAIDTGAVPIFSSAAVWFEDFYGTTMPDEITLLSGTDDVAVDPAIAQGQYGLVELVGGDSNANAAADSSILTLGLHWSADQGSLVFETRVHINNITDATMCVGLSDDIATVEIPFELTGDTDTGIAVDFIGFCFDTDATTDEWWFVGNNNGTEATGNAATGVAPANGVFQILRVEVDANGEDARGYINGVLEGTITANSVAEAVLLAPHISVQSLTTAARTMTLDYIYVGAQRQ